jgi:hypothetical protein
LHLHLPLFLLLLLLLHLLLRLHRRSNANRRIWMGWQAVRTAHRALSTGHWALRSQTKSAAHRSQ